MQSIGIILEKRDVQDHGVNQNLYVIRDRMSLSPQLGRSVIAICNKDVAPTSDLLECVWEILFQPFKANRFHVMLGRDCRLDCNDVCVCTNDSIKAGICS